MVLNGLMENTYNGFHKQNKTHFSQLGKFEPFMAVTLPILLLHEFPRFAKNADNVLETIFFILPV